MLTNGRTSPIPLSAQTDGKQELVSFSDSGPGVLDAKSAHIFRPFYRAEESRDRKSGDVGLGLAIAKSSVEACGGQIRAENGRPRGLTVSITLDAAEPSTAA